MNHNKIIVKILTVQVVNNECDDYKTGFKEKKNIVTHLEVKIMGLKPTLLLVLINYAEFIRASYPSVNVDDLNPLTLSWNQVI